jgi:hypothetical protein
MTHPRPPVVMGIDPGVSTGVAIGFPQESGYGYVTFTAKEPAEVWGAIAGSLSVNVLIVEQFSAQLISKYGIHTVEVIGGVIALAWDRSIEVIRDTPQQRRPYMEYAKARVPPRGAHTQHDLRHEVDALSHVVRYLYKSGHITSLEV